MSCYYWIFDVYINLNMCQSNEDNPNSVPHFQTRQISVDQIRMTTLNPMQKNMRWKC